MSEQKAKNGMPPGSSNLFPAARRFTLIELLVGTGGYAPIFARHALKANLLFLDGHAEAEDNNQRSTVVWSAK